MTFTSPARPLPTRTQPGPQYQFIATAETCLFYACPVYKLWGAGPVLMPAWTFVALSPAPPTHVVPTQGAGRITAFTAQLVAQSVWY